MSKCSVNSKFLETSCTSQCNH